MRSPIGDLRVAETGRERRRSGRFIGGRKLVFTGLGFVCAALIGGTDLAFASEGAPIDTSPPTVVGTAEVGQTLQGDAGSWTGRTPMDFAYQWQRCNSSGGDCVSIDGATEPSYTLLSTDVGSTLRLHVTASNYVQSRTSTSELIGLAPPPSEPPPLPLPQCSDGIDNDGDGLIDYPNDPGCTSASDNDETDSPTGGTYFGTEPSHASGLPRSDSYCAGAIIHNAWEPRPDNYPANSTQGPADPSTLPWGPDAIKGFWTEADAKVRQVTGHFTGTTTEIISWAACKWGIDEDTIRAEAVAESDWRQYLIGDTCSDSDVSTGSFSILQVKNKSCNGSLAFGGYPYTQNSTALGVDIYAAQMRACYDGDFYDGGSWLYGGQTVDQIAAAKGSDYVLWGCIGSWFSGSWYDAGAVDYILKVKTSLAARIWLTYQ